jgi:hypothetical protein
MTFLIGSFTRDGYDFALFFDREVDDEGQVKHIKRYNTCNDYANLWTGGK